MMKEKKTFQPLKLSDVCTTYRQLYSRGLVSFPITSEAEKKIEAILANVHGSYFGLEPYASPEEKVVAYLYFLINDHPFTDGNKRTASLSFLASCDLNGLNPNFEGFSLDELAVTLERLDGDHQHIIRIVTTLLFYKK